jgi:hypothetical protein
MTHNKFLETYPKLWIPQIDSKVRIIKIYKDNGWNTPYLIVDSVCSIYEFRDEILYTGRFKLTDIEIKRGFSGICKIGYPLEHFVPYYE